MSDYNGRDIGKSILEFNNFMSVATCHNNDIWIAPVYYVNDDYNNLYFVSSQSSKHVIHIILNNSVAISIFNSDQEEGVGNTNGLQIKGTASKIPKLQYPNIIKLFYKKDGILNVSNEKIADKIKEYDNNNRAIFQIKIDEAYIQDTEYFKQHKIDKRLQINL